MHSETQPYAAGYKLRWRLKFLAITIIIKGLGLRLGLSPLSYIIPWRSGSAWKSVAKNMADFGLCWRHLVPTATGIYLTNRDAILLTKSFTPLVFAKKFMAFLFSGQSLREKSFLFRLWT